MRKTSPCCMCTSVTRALSSTTRTSSTLWRILWLHLEAWLVSALASVCWVLLSSSTSSASGGVYSSAGRGRRPSIGHDIYLWLWSKWWIISFESGISNHRQAPEVHLFLTSIIWRLSLQLCRHYTHFCLHLALCVWKAKFWSHKPRHFLMVMKVLWSS